MYESSAKYEGSWSAVATVNVPITSLHSNLKSHLVTTFHYAFHLEYSLHNWQGQESVVEGPLYWHDIKG
jgi:hypothetical protein